ncbi:acyl-CoA dehydrogenase [Marinicauda algicola]|uniref:Acyl-coenzyme A dehydrogenase n=1 Tax=Marinicauda algicola TaxID=2029849 RepID=A0A4S2H4L9_9PROT|nr:acyl-CoA dehydrogenase [Marinicauda algicola]TGY90605.1 acyl-CoA dehydrogenase [Marinicauda algicola]
MPEWRRNLISKPVMDWYAGLLPDMSDTEAQAIEAGTVWWDREILSGKPDWDYLIGLETGTLTDEERAFIDGPVQKLCAMLDDWQIEHEERDLPEEVWDYMISEGFFAMIIPAEYGGKGFSAYAHSEVVRTIGTRSITAAVTVMVPNSLGPGELLMLYGTDEQKDHYLPRLASGKEIPCFALTGVEAGSDASAMSDYAIVVEREIDGEKTLGIEITCNKRYITLAPVATIAGLAFKLFDPDRLLGEEEELGITVALVPTDSEGLDTGRRHLPSGLAFQNGPVRGKDVFVPIGQILGGREQIGQGWKMLMGALAAGRGISLPSMSCAGAAVAAHSSGAYARIREQFGRPIGEFEGVKEPLARIAASTYLLDGARLLTTAGIDEGEKPAVVSAIMKYHATERLRSAINDAMDIHGGKAICEGPRNHLATAYKSIPVAITVEGANILTRSLIVFGQGAIRCHPYLLKEMKAVANPDKDEGLKQFDEALFGHLAHDVKIFARSFVHGLTFGRFTETPEKAGELGKYYRELSHASLRLAVISELALAVMGGALKKKESLSARLGDVLAEIYLLSGAIKRYESEGRQEADRALLDWCFADGLYRIQQRLQSVMRHFPGLHWRMLLSAILSPVGMHRRPPSDDLTHEVADLILKPCGTRERLTRGVYVGEGEAPLAVMERALAAIVRRDALLEKVRKSGVSLDNAVENGVLSAAERAEIDEAEETIRAVLVVDDFEPEELKGATLSPSARNRKDAA